MSLLSKIYPLVKSTYPSIQSLYVSSSSLQKFVKDKIVEIYSIEVIS
jgi:hypothetical protein